MPDPIAPIIASYTRDQRARALRALWRDVVIGFATAAVLLAA